MQKQIPSKKIIIIIGAAIAAVIAAVILFMPKEEEFFRSILVYELEGNAVIERADIGAVDAAENLYLESGDRVSVDEDSMMRMKLDDDKYITAEENTVFSLVAEGDAQDSKTKISLEQGAITNEIQNSLSSESLYETSTPNSVMAVRGTIYRVELYDNGEGGEDMRLCCFQGTVAATPVLPDGTLGEEALVHAGSELTIDSEGVSYGIRDIDYESLSKQALETLSALAESGKSFEGITNEELLGLISSFDEDGLSSDAQEEPETEEAFEEDDSSADTADSEENETDGKKNGDDKAKQNPPSSGNKSSGSKNSGKGDSDHGSGGSQVQDPSNGSGGSGEQNPNDGPGGSQDPNTGDGSGGSGEQNPGDGSGDQNPGDDSADQPEEPSENETYKVTFMYQGSVFAVQIVKKGDKATAPVLSPAAEGAWDFDFNMEITGDTIIEWKQM